MNCLQMLHGAYSIQNWQEYNELKKLWSHLQDDVENEKFKKIEESNMTRFVVGRRVCLQF